ncbi:Autophagy 18 f isoform [Thalictrum thalictroides]|uniref:Autophagy 18 f isoform n=1 Tax=Thalictrum thalictroides TaxID=46969 RepID=A0A7J6W0Y0_THATH|nr:Autophagy 18 f isoform [Thalictrum thalictroides]
MRNDVQKPQIGGVPRLGRSNGIIPSSFRSLSGYLRTVSSGASSVASTVRSAGASVASSIVDKIEDASSDQVQWAGFDKLECEGDGIRQVLLLGYRSGFQVWDVEEANNVRELVSRHDGPVSFLQVLPKPIASKTSKDKFADVRSLLVVVSNGSFSGSSTVHDGISPSYNGSVANGIEQGKGNFAPSIVQFYSLKSQSYVHVLKFRSAVYSVRCSPRVVAISQAAQIHCFDAATLEMEYTLLTYPLVSSSLGYGNIGCGPLAVGSRWLAYSGSPVAISTASRVCPTPAAGQSGSALNGSLVAHYAKESSKQLAAGIVTLGDIGYKKLSRYYSELLPDGSNSLKSGSPGWKTTSNGHLPDAENAGMVIVRDIVCKSVITQFKAHRNPISALSFDPSGTLLVTASVQGHTINVFRIMPSLTGSSSGSDSDESYMHLYILQRGITNAVIQDISFSEDSHWIMISSSRGTSHLFAINPAGGTVSTFTDGFVSTNSNRLGLSSKSAVRWLPNSSLNDHQSVCASGPPVTLSAISRIRNGNSGWRGTVSGAAAAATGRIGTYSGATASAFHNCKGNGVFIDSSSLRTKYHLLVFSPSGSVVQYVLRPSSGPDCEIIGPGSTAFYDSAPDGDAVVVEALQKWDICQRRSRRERDDNSDVYGEYGSGDRNKIYPEEMKNANNVYPTVKGKIKISSEERHHLYISEAELQMHQARIPLWAKSEIYFQNMVLDGLEAETGNSGGETEIERFSIRVIEARCKDLVPVYDYLQAHKLQQSRASSFDSNRSESMLHQKSGLSEDGRLLCRSSCSSLGSSLEGASVGDHRNGIEDNGWGCLQTQLAEGFVNNNDSPNSKAQLEFVNNSERPNMVTDLKLVNNNKGSLKMDGHFNNDDNELD